MKIKTHFEWNWHECNEKTRIGKLQWISQRLIITGKETIQDDFHNFNWSDFCCMFSFESEVLSKYPIVFVYCQQPLVGIYNIMLCHFEELNLIHIWSFHICTQFRLFERRSLFLFTHFL